MSIWLDSNGKTYMGTGQNAWLKEYVDRTTDSLKQEVDANLSPHFTGTGHRHRAEDIDLDQTTVKSALDTETETRTKADAALETALAEETAARETANNDILAEVRSLNLQNGSGSGSLRSTGSAGNTGEDAVQLGKDCQATGERSHAQNYGTIAASPCQSARGSFNEKDDKGDYADIVGNGTSDTKRSNAYTLDWEGNGHFAGDVFVGKNKEKLAIANACLPGMTNYQGEINIGSFKAYKEDASFFQDDVDCILEKVESLTQDMDPTQTAMCVIHGDCTYHVIEDTLENGSYLVGIEGNSFPVYGWVYWRPDHGDDGSVHIRNSVILFQDILDGRAIFHYSRTGTYTEGETWEQSGVWGDWQKDSYRGQVTRKELSAEVEDIQTDISRKLDKDTIITETADNTLVLEENQDARLGETSSLVLSMPESIGDWYRSTFSFQSGESATSLVYGYTPLDWKGDDVTSDGRFVPEPFSTYEVDVKNLGINGIRARVDKIAGYSSVDVEGTILSLPSSAGKALRDYKIYGNSVQDGEPSEETPVDIQSVGDYNEETGKYDVPVVVGGKNLLNPQGKLENALKGTNHYLGVNFDELLGEEGILSIRLKNGKTVPSGIYFGIVKMSGADKPVARWLVSGESGVLDAQSKTSQVYAEGAKSIGIGVFPATQENWDLIFDAFDVQFERGDTATEYEPYHDPVTTTISLDEPLRKVGDTADYIDYTNNCVVQQVEVLDDTGTLPIEESYTVKEQPIRYSYHLGSYLEGYSRFIPTIDTNMYDNVITIDTEIQPSNVKVTYFKKEG